MHIAARDRIESVDASNAAFLTVVLNDPAFQYGYPDAELGDAGPISIG